MEFRVLKYDMTWRKKEGKAHFFLEGQDREGKTHMYVLSLPTAEAALIAGILRHEKPVTWDETNECLTIGPEPVGEEEVKDTITEPPTSSETIPPAPAPAPAPVKPPD